MLESAGGIRLRISAKLSDAARRTGYDHALGNRGRTARSAQKEIGHGEWVGLWVREIKRLCPAAEIAIPSTAGLRTTFASGLVAAQEICNRSRPIPDRLRASAVRHYRDLGRLHRYAAREDSGDHHHGHRDRPQQSNGHGTPHSQSTEVRTRLLGRSRSTSCATRLQVCLAAG